MARTFKVEGRGSLEGFVAYGVLMPYDEKDLVLSLVLKLDESFHLFGNDHQYIGVNVFRSCDDNHIMVDGWNICDLYMSPEELNKLQSIWMSSTIYKCLQQSI